MKYDIEAVFTLPDSVRIYSGFNATAELVITEKKDIMIIPESYLTFRNASVFVNVLERGKSELRQIESGISDNINIEVISGIHEDDKLLKKMRTLPNGNCVSPPIFPIKALVMPAAFMASRSF